MPVARLLVGLLVALAIAPTANAQFWNPFRSKPKAEAAQQGQPAKLAMNDYTLTEESGPWLILATTFSGEGAEDQARELCAELGEALRLPTYVHEMTFNVADDQPVGRGVDRYGAPVKMRYRSGGRHQEWAVLIGDYPAIDDTIAERDLATIKKVKPRALSIGEDGVTHQNLANHRTITAYLTGKKDADGPMRTAFLTRNPILPEKYFRPQGVDKFVEKMNKDLEYTALDIKGNQTIKVATFRGRGTLVGASQARSSKSRRKKSDTDPLVEAAENAHLLCEAMRAKGWEAYEFHDRTQSYVTVGSFESVTDATGQPLPEVAEIVRTFGAAYNTPSAPLDRQRGNVTDSARATQVKQTFNNLFKSEVGQVATGLHPKYAQVSYAEGEAPRPIPFDVYPDVIDAPKRTVSSAFAWRR